ncbi:hypothetical protein niasHT_014142 [Heterodera trifolii]|uniref:CCHC-type domain-containing protein n=1 Tax=Heterodera trifolii TaxID=157864 RepID=A0ABD2KXU9_9BILA
MFAIRSPSPPDANSVITMPLAICSHRPDANLIITMPMAHPCLATSLLAIPPAPILRSQQETAVCACARVDFLRRAGDSRSICFICFENGHEKKNCSRHQLRLQFEQIRALFGNLQRRTSAKTTTDSAASPFWASWSGRRGDDIRRHRYAPIGKENRGSKTKKQAAAEDDLVGQNAAEMRGPQNICQRREWRRESAQRRLGDRSAVGCSKW